MTQLNSLTDAFVFKVKKRTYTCIRKDVLNSLRQLGELHIYIANESIIGWGYDAEEIASELRSFNLNHEDYRFRDEASLTTTQLQALINTYMSFSNSDDKPEVPTII